MRDAGDRDGVERAMMGNPDCQHHAVRAAHHVLHGREGGALAAKLLLRGRGVRIGFEMRAGVHHHADLRKQQRQRQYMHEPTAIASNQNGGLRGRVFPQAAPSTSSTGRKLQRCNAPSTAPVRTI